MKTSVVRLHQWPDTGTAQNLPMYSLSDVRRRFLSLAPEWTDSFCPITSSLCHLSVLIDTQSVSLNHRVSMLTELRRQTTRECHINRSIYLSLEMYHAWDTPWCPNERSSIWDFLFFPSPGLRTPTTCPLRFLLQPWLTISRPSYHTICKDVTDDWLGSGL